MHNNYYFLRQLSKTLEQKLIGTVLSECFSQSKDELIIRFETKLEPFFIKASLTSSFSCLSFPDTFHRARKNSINLFEGIIGHRVVAIKQFENERSFAILLDDDKSLLFKMHGNRSNIILFDAKTVSERFKNNYPSDTTICISNQDRTIDWSYETFQQHEDKPGSLYFTFGKPIWAYLHQHGFDTLNTRSKYEMIQQLRTQLDNPSFYLCEVDNSIQLSLLPTATIIEEFSDPITAANRFYHAFTHDFAFRKERQALISTLTSRIQSSKNYIDKTFQKLEEITNDTNYKVWADLVMANMHDIKTGMEKVTLQNFYDNNQPIEIKLKKDLNAQSNAAIFYKKAKNQHIEIERLEAALSAKEKEIFNLQQTQAEVEAIDNLKALRQKVEAEGPLSEKGKLQEAVPYHEFMVDNYKIWVGKNARSNDDLTLRCSYKEDLWLHAKDVEGSHVLIKHIAGRTFPKNVIERAAELAAYNSKRKTDSLCPVIYTPKKFVRKRKGDPPGAVIVEKESVIMVVPRL